MSYWKAPIQTFLSQEIDWAWHHPRAGHGYLTENLPILLKLFRRHPLTKIVQISNFFHLPFPGLSFDVYNSLLSQLA